MKLITHNIQRWRARAYLVFERMLQVLSSNCSFKEWRTRYINWILKSFCFIYSHIGQCLHHFITDFPIRSLEDLPDCWYDSYYVMIWCDRCFDWAVGDCGKWKRRKILTKGEEKASAIAIIRFMTNINIF